MLATFDRPEDPDVKEFRMKACHSAGEDGSGDVRTLSGWLTSFCWWTASGARQKVYGDKEVQMMGNFGARFEMDGVVFPVIGQAEIPTGITTTPITWIEVKKKVDIILVAGLAGMKLIDDTGSRVRPASGWWILMGDSTGDGEQGGG